MREVIGSVRGPLRGQNAGQCEFHDESGYLLRICLLDDGFFFPHLVPFADDFVVPVPPERFAHLHPLLAELALNGTKEGPPSGWFEPRYIELCEKLGVEVAAVAPAFPAETRAAGRDVITALNRWFRARAGTFDRPKYSAYFVGVEIARTLLGTSRPATIRGMAEEDRQEWTYDGWDLLRELRAILGRHGFTNMLAEITRAPQPD